MKNIKISVIIAIYNKMKQLNRILKALNNQEELPYEVIIADDGSSEILEEKIGDIIPKLKFKLKHVYQEDKGFRVSASRNNGIINAEGNYILFIDQDILFDTDFIKNIKRSIKEGEILKLRAVYLDETRSEEIKKIISENKEIKFEKIKKVITQKEYKHLYNRYFQDTGKSILFNFNLRKRPARLVGLGIGSFKEDLIKVNGFDEKYEGWGLEDHDLGNRFAALGLKMKTLFPSNIIVHIWHPIAKGESPNEEYFNEREKKILLENEYSCEFGCNNRLRKEEVKVRNLR